MQTKGFMTLATGDEKYYIAAENLLKSYLLFHTQSSKYNNKKNDRLPFTILADRKNKYTELFDNVIILKNPTRSYLDKISILNHIPYDKTVFVESDCLAYSDLNEYFDIFKDADEFSVLGRTVPPNSKIGWFLLEETGEYKDKINFIPRFHSAVIYMQKGNKCSQMYNICMEVNENYKNYMIGGSREAIDDKLFALSSSVVGCKPTLLEMRYYNCYPQVLINGWKPRLQMHKKKNSFYIKRQKEKVDNAIICHFGNYLTTKYLYKREIHTINSLLKCTSPLPYIYATSFIYPLYKLNEYFHFFVFNKFISIISKVKFFKKIWHAMRK